MEDNIKLLVMFGKEDNEECYIRIEGTLDREFFEALQEVMIEHGYTESL